MEKILAFYQSLKSYMQKHSSSESTYIEFDNFFQSEKMLNIFGFNNLPQVMPLKRIKIRRIFYSISMMISVIFLGVNIFSIAYGFKHNGSFLIFTENVGVVCIESLILMKGFTVVFWNREKVKNIVVKLKQHFPNDAWDQYVFSVLQHLKNLRICGKICFVLYKGVTLEFVSMPILILLYGFVFSKDVKLETIVQLTLPLDTSDPLNYALLYIINALAFYIGIFTVLITDLLFTELLAVINMELTIFGQLISEVDPALGQDEAISELKKLSKAHQELIQLSEDLRDIQSPLIFIDCFGMMINMCCAAFLTLVMFLIDFN